jgi:hypothetical protein
MFTPFIIRSRSRGIIPSDVSGLLVWNRGDTGLKTGGARQFTAANDEHLSYTDDAAYDLSTGDIMMAAFVYRDSQALQTIASKYEDNDNYWIWEITAANLLYFKARVGGSDVIEMTGTTALAASQFYSVIASVDRSAAANTTFYVDGVAEVSGTPTVGTTDISNAGTFVLGAAWT